MVMVAMEPTVVVMVPGATVLVLAHTVIAVVCMVARTGRHQAVGDVPRVTIPCLRVDRPGLASATAVAGVIVPHDTHTAAARCPDAAAATVCAVVTVGTIGEAAATTVAIRSHTRMEPRRSCLPMRRSCWLPCASLWTWICSRSHVAVPRVT